MKDKVEIRGMLESDNVCEVADLIALSDEYIYSVLTPTILSSLIKTNTIYNYKNIKLALINNRIVGTMVLLNKDYKRMLNNTLEILPNTKEMITLKNEYFKDIKFETDSYVLSISVLASSRGLGIGRMMLESIRKSSTLEVLEENKKAIKLYETLGYKTFLRYKAYPDIFCVKMIKEINPKD